MTTKKDPRAEEAANAKYGSSPDCESAKLWRAAFLCGVSWKEANPTPQATDAKMPPRVWLYETSLEFTKRCAGPCNAYIDRDKPGDSHMLVAYVPEGMLSQARAEARAEAFEEAARDMIAIRNLMATEAEAIGVLKTAERWMDEKAKAPVEPAKAAGSPNGAGEKS